MRLLSLKDLGFGLVHKFDTWSSRFTEAAYFRAGLLNRYQRNPFDMTDNDGSDGYRPSAARFAAISDLIDGCGPLSVIDVGCSIGYFVFQFAKRGGFCLGVDYNFQAIRAARALAKNHGVGNAVFALLEIDTDRAATLPRADMVICLSVFHHWARKFGEQQAVEITSALASRADRYFVFETGQPDETSKDWAQAVEFMNPDSEAWIRTFLTGLGFDQITSAGPFATNVSDVPRTLYVAYRSAADSQDSPTAS